jgi:hypothetical protein
MNRAKILRLGEREAIDIIAGILGTSNVIRNRGNFDWLRGDTGYKLRVDAYFPDQKLVFEYQGRQHYEPNGLMDRRPGRAEQRRRYSELRKQLVPENGLRFFELRYDEPMTEACIRGKLRAVGFDV